MRSQPAWVDYQHRLHASFPALWATWVRLQFRLGVVGSARRPSHDAVRPISQAACSPGMQNSCAQTQEQPKDRSKTTPSTVLAYSPLPHTTLTWQRTLDALVHRLAWLCCIAHSGAILVGAFLHWLLGLFGLVRLLLLRLLGDLTRAGQGKGMHTEHDNGQQSITEPCSRARGMRDHSGAADAARVATVPAPGTRAQRTLHCTRPNCGLLPPT